MLSTSTSANVKSKLSTKNRKYFTEVLITPPFPNRVLIIKHAVELVATDLTAAIGAPEDYNKNLEKGRFPDNTDITIPSDKRQSSAPIEVKMDNINLSEKKPAHVAPDHFPESDQYMPIKCLN
jgi:hypothetical protein